jgi:divalent metal cation (Fe/Co/Zn/Cd) transporter
MFAPAWSILDALLVIAVAVYIVHTSFALLKRSADGLMDAALLPREVQHAEAINCGALPPDASFVVATVLP